jgi:hypothetical protein
MANSNIWWFTVAGCAVCFAILIDGCAGEGIRRSAPSILTHNVEQAKTETAGPKLRDKPGALGSGLNDRWLAPR